jgi:tRNA(Ile)-lysidine synthase TilS/MesJ
MKVCTKCVLPETFPGIRFDLDGVCNYCHQSERRVTKLAEEKARYHQKFLNLLKELKQPNKPDKPNKPNKRSYDVLLAYSGGKDSSYTLKLLKRDFNLRVLAITFNHGFVSEQALKNIETVSRALDVDHLMVSPNQRMLCQAFRRSIDSDLYPLKALERASSICNTCMNFTKSILLKYAIALGIPLIAYGWSPGQAPIQSSVMKWNLSMIHQIQSVMANTFKQILKDDLSPLLLGESEFKRVKEFETLEGIYLFNIHPLAFLDYNEEKIIEEIRLLGWVDPKDTDSNSTNCLLNAFGNQTHQGKYGFHPYAFEIGGLVREGYMSREEGLRKLSVLPDPIIVSYVKERLGIK